MIPIMLWLPLGSNDEAASALDSLCRADLTVDEFFTNDLGKWTPCFIDVAVLGGSYPRIEKKITVTDGVHQELKT